MSINCKHDSCRYECERQVGDGLIATTYGAGPFHPAIKFGSTIWYWPNITKDTENEAWEWADATVGRALKPAQEITDEWNIRLA